MARFRDISIQRKQTVLMTLITAVTLMLTCVAFVAYDMSLFRRELVEEVTSLAEVVGNTSMGALDFDDPKAATEALSALRGDSDIVAGAIYDKQGKVFAVYNRSQTNPFTLPPVAATGHQFTKQHLHMYRTIVHDGETVGTIYIVCGLEEFTERLTQYAIIVGLVLVGALVVGLLLSNWLQRLISEPILHLAQVTRTVASEKNYSIRATKRGNDELGRLIDGFNEMLGQIQERDRALEGARENLELRVRERTQELSGSLSLLHATLEASADAVVATDMAGKVTCCNKKFIELWHLPPDVVVRMEVGEMVALALKQTKDPVTFAADIERTRNSPEIESLGTFEMNDGRIIERLTTPQYVGEKCSGVVVTFRDVTERRRAMAALTSSEQRFRSVWESSIEGMRLTNAYGSIVAVNEAYCRLVGLPREKLVGQLFSIVYAGHGPTDGMETYRQRFEEGSIKPRIEAKVSLWNAVEVDVEVSNCYVESGDGRLVLSLFRDVTERKRTERELRDAQAELLQISRKAGMAEVATSVLHNVGNVLNSVNTSTGMVIERLRATRVESLGRMAETIEQHRGDLGAFFSAERRAEQMVTFLKSLAQHFTTERSRALNELGELAKNVEHIKQIVAMQQNYARVAGVTEKIKVTDLVEDALRMNEGGLERHGIQMRRLYPPDVPEVLVDKHKVLQILVNLVRNAKHACDDSKRKDKQVSIQVMNGSDEVSIVVVDNGVGIPAENLTRIFSHGFTTRKSGHGFGLHSGALAAKELGGSLTVQSAGPGQGATFTLQLPLQPRKKSL